MYNYILVPGLGFNSLTFRNLKLSRAASVQYLDWLEPLHEDEEFEGYIERMVAQIPGELPNKVFIGHSFGGVMVQELAQRVPYVEKVFIISSIKSPEEMSWNVRMFRTVPLYKIVSHGLINSTFPIWAKLHDFNNEEERKAFMEMVNDMTMFYFKWAVHAISNWQGIAHRKIHPVHIHGDKDRTLYYKDMMNPILLRNGGHFMVYNRADEISEIISTELDASYVPVFDS